MLKYILLVINNEDFEKELKTRLKELADRKFSGKNGQDRLIVDIANDLENARARIEDSPKKYTILIADLHLFPDNQTTSHENRKLGLTLLRKLNKTDVPVFSILICPESDQEIFDFLADCKGRMRCETLIKKGNWVELFQRKVEKGMGSIMKKEKKLGKIDIFLDENKYAMEGNGFPFHIPLRPLKEIESFYKDDIIKRSREFSEKADWDYELHFIGGFLLRSLFYKNPKFHTDFMNIVAAASGVENIRIRYIVEENIHPLALEAIVDDKNNYHMLHFPIFRSLKKDCTQSPLFKDEETRKHPVNFLIINANSGGKIQKEKDNNTSQPIPLPLLDLHLKHLKKADEEAIGLETQLTGNSLLGIVDLVKPEENEDGFDKRVKGIIKNGIWHVVHFIGHSFYDGKEKKGYVFFPGRRGQPRPVEIAIFARWLRRAQVRLVYLSSCSSADVDFVFKLSENNIPAILGFRCPIDDDKAMEHAFVFYEKLFQGSKRLEYAFLETRRELARKYEEKNYIWAASILTMQSKE